MVGFFCIQRLNEPYRQLLDRVSPKCSYFVYTNICKYPLTVEEPTDYSLSKEKKISNLNKYRATPGASNPAGITCITSLIITTPSIFNPCYKSKLFPIRKCIKNVRVVFLETWSIYFKITARPINQGFFFSLNIREIAQNEATAHIFLNRDKVTLLSSNGFIFPTRQCILFHQLYGKGKRHDSQQARKVF